MPVEKVSLTTEAQVVLTEATRIPLDQWSGKTSIGLRTASKEIASNRLRLANGFHTIQILFLDTDGLDNPIPSVTLSRFGKKRTLDLGPAEASAAYELLDTVSANIARRRAAELLDTIQTLDLTA